MKVIIDTSSLLSLARYYLPFDHQSKLYNFIKTEFENGNLILIDAVYQECKYTSKGQVLKVLPYLDDKEFRKKFIVPLNTKNLLPPAPKKFYGQINNHFRTPLSRKLNEAEFEERKKEYLESADARMIILGLIMKHEGEDFIIVTEESEFGNDHKTFKKIPAICKLINIEVMTLPQLLNAYKGIDIQFE